MIRSLLEKIVASIEVVAILATLAAITVGGVWAELFFFRINHPGAPWYGILFH